jgi:hypothetical protein
MTLRVPPNLSTGVVVAGAVVVVAGVDAAGVVVVVEVPQLVRIVINTNSIAREIVNLFTFNLLLFF